MSTLRALRRSTPLLRAATRNAQPLLTTTTRFVVTKPQAITAPPARSISTTTTLRIALTEAADTKDAVPAKESEPHDAAPSEPTPLTDDEYKECSDRYMESLFEKLEASAEEKGGLEVEFSAGVLTIDIKSIGTYVVNKQPPNKQIWLSSPVSGPKRFDYVMLGDSMNQKEGAGVGEWIYLRDGTSLTDLLKKEVGVDVTAVAVDAEA